MVDMYMYIDLSVFVYEYCVHVFIRLCMYMCEYISMSLCFTILNECCQYCTKGEMFISISLLLPPFYSLKVVE